MSQALDDTALDRLFRDARTHNRFEDKPVSDEQVHELYALLKWGPTAFNSQPGRYLFIRSADAKQRLAATMSSSNREKTLAAPLNVVVAYDLQFHKQLPRLTESPKAQAIFENHPELLEPTALRSGALQGAYLILAARALGLDVGVMTGFDAQALGQALLDEHWRPNFVANIGYGRADALKPRHYRFAFDEVARIL